VRCKVHLVPGIDRFDLSPPLFVVGLELAVRDRRYHRNTFSGQNVPYEVVIANGAVGDPKAHDENQEADPSGVAQEVEEIF
jgi:hypothetical protein